MDENNSRTHKSSGEIRANNPAIEAIPQLLQSFHLLSIPAMEGAVRRIDSLLKLLDKADENEDVVAIAVEAWNEKVLGDIPLNKMTKEELTEQLTTIRDVVRKTIVDASYESQQEVYASSKEFHEQYDYAVASEGYAYATELAYLKTLGVNGQLVKDILSGKVRESLSNQILSHEIGSPLFGMKQSEITERAILNTAYNMGLPKILGLAEQPSAQNGYVGGAFQFDSVYILDEPFALDETGNDSVMATMIAFKEYKDSSNVFVIANDKALDFHSLRPDTQQRILSAISRSLELDKEKGNKIIPDDFPKMIEDNRLVYQMNTISSLEKEWSALIRKTMVGENSINLSKCPCPPFNYGRDRYLGLQMISLYLERVADPSLSPCWAGKVDLARHGYDAPCAKEYSSICLGRNGIVQLRPLANFKPDDFESLLTVKEWDDQFRSQLNSSERADLYHEAMHRFNNSSFSTPFDAAMASLYFAVRVGYNCGPVSIREDDVKDLLVDNLSVEEITSRRENPQNESLYSCMLSVCSRCMQIELEMQLGLRTQTHIPDMKVAVTKQAIEEFMAEEQYIIEAESVDQQISDDEYCPEP